MRPQVGQLINNKYRLMRLIGDGGMGSVFEAQHEVLHTSVALKFLHPELSKRAGLVQRFLQEARVSAKIQSPHVVRVTDVEQTQNGLAFIVMEYLNGTSLQALYEDLYRAGKRLSYDEAINYSLQMLDGLEAAHDEGIVHRDLKPDNVMIVKGKKGEPLVKLLDFGIAKLKINGELYKGLTRPGVIMGTPEYMAPEQVFSADQVDARADIFSCGVMIFEMLAGRRPVGGDEPHQIAAQYLAGSFAKLTDLAPHIAPELSVIVHKAMAADAKDRFGSAAEFREAMEPFSNRLAASDRGRATPLPTTSSVRSPVAAPAISVHPDSDPLAATAGVLDGGSTDKISRAPFSSAPDSPQVSVNRASNGTAVIASAAVPSSDPFARVPASRPFERTEDSFASSGNLAPLPGTVDAAPFNGGSTEGYEPLPYRPGGTNIGDMPGAIPGTVGYAPYGSQTPSAYASYNAVPTPARKKRGLGVGGILLVAAIVGAGAVGGVYGYTQYNQEATTHPAKKPPKTVPSPKQTQPQPTETAVTQLDPTNPPQQTPEPPRTNAPPQPTQVSRPQQPNPNPNPQPQPNPNPPPTQAPWVVPSQITIPGIEVPPWLQQPQPQPNPQPQPEPQPKPENPGRPKIPPIGDVVIPKRHLPEIQKPKPEPVNPAPAPSNSNTTPNTPAPAPANPHQIPAPHKGPIVIR